MPQSKDKCYKCPIYPTITHYIHICMHEYMIVLQGNWLHVRINTSSHTSHYKVIFKQKFKLSYPTILAPITLPNYPPPTPAPTIVNAHTYTHTYILHMLGKPYRRNKYKYWSNAFEQNATYLTQFVFPHNFFHPGVVSWRLWEGWHLCRLQMHRDILWAYNNMSTSFPPPSPPTRRGGINSNELFLSSGCHTRTNVW